MELISIKTSQHNPEARISKLEIGVHWLSKEACQVFLNGTVLGLSQSDKTIQFLVGGKVVLPDVSSELSDTFDNPINNNYEEESNLSVIEAPFLEYKDKLTPVGFKLSFSANTTQPYLFSIYLGKAIDHPNVDLKQTISGSLPVDILDVHFFYSASSESINLYPLSRQITATLEESIRNLYRSELDLSDQHVLSWNIRGITAINPFEISQSAISVPKPKIERPKQQKEKEEKPKKEKKGCSKTALIILAFVLVCILLSVVILLGIVF